MARYAVVEQSTDPYDRRTKVRFFASRRSALEYAAQGGECTYPDPETAQNWHHTLLPKEWRKPRDLGKLARGLATPPYPCTAQDALGWFVAQAGERVRVL
jgi:hypothetical protein